MKSCVKCTVGLIKKSFRLKCLGDIYHHQVLIIHIFVIYVYNLIHIFIFYIYIIIIITLHWWHEVPRYYFAIYPYHPLLLVGLLGCISCPYRSDVSLCWSANIGASIFKIPLEIIVYEFFFSSQAVLHMIYEMVIRDGTFNRKNNFLKFYFHTVKLHQNFLWSKFFV